MFRRLLAVSANCAGRARFHRLAAHRTESCAKLVNDNDDDVAPPQMTRARHAAHRRR